MKHRHRVCPVCLAGWLTFPLRRWLQDPLKILGPYVKEGMTAMDFGCGPGFFTLDMARLAGPTGRVIAADLQEGMLDKVQARSRGTELEARIAVHLCGEQTIGLSIPLDFVLAFYMVHELPDQPAFFRELGTLVKPGGQVLIVEPPIHVSKAAFERTLGHAQQAGFAPVERPALFPNKAAVLRQPLKEVPGIHSGG